MRRSYMLLTASNRFDYNDMNGGTSFKDRYDWKQYQMMKDFSKWGAESFDESLFRPKTNALNRQHFRGPTDRRH